MGNHSNHDWSTVTTTEKPSHDSLVLQSTTKNISTVIHVYNSSVPRCQSFLSKFETWAKEHASLGDNTVQYVKMDYTSEISLMFKFAPNQLPITVLKVGERWARTVVGTELEETEELIGEMVGECRRLPDG
jgi:hypothetical protein